MHMSAFRYTFSFQQLQWSSISITEDEFGTKKDLIFFFSVIKQKSVKKACIRIAKVLKVTCTMRSE